MMTPPIREKMKDDKEQCLHMFMITVMKTLGLPLSGRGQPEAQKSFGGRWLIKKKVA